MAELLDGFATVPIGNFLGLSDDESAFASADVVVMPVPYEATVSWRGGTAAGPRAILDASRFVELYDHELDRQPSAVGVHTLPELHLTKTGPEHAMAELGRAYQRVTEAEKFAIVVGGEHALSGPLILRTAERLSGRRLSVLQLDAHADLRSAYEGTPYSHASVMYRVREHVDLVPVGIRSVCPEERELIRDERVPIVWAHEIDPAGRWIDRTVAALGPDVYVTIDVDFFDPSIVPSTGTPEPGGGSWYPTLELLRRVFLERTVHAADVVEFAPIAGLHAPDFLVAKLIHKLIGFRQLAREEGD